eukprot:TRINITY_DN51482_c1_g2_i1.p2 TRINITY_DN51482_c1_g2~~TRINITY_DN51482_c1_g2_i1.p2  ORF type:complete len:188 (-),score=17.65 TRINITY_DN51482_c1_g2_i1:248-811(-)
MPSRRRATSSSSSRRKGEDLLRKALRSESSESGAAGRKNAAKRKRSKSRKDTGRRQEKKTRRRSSSSPAQRRTKRRAQGGFGMGPEAANTPVAPMPAAVVAPSSGSAIAAVGQQTAVAPVKTDAGPRVRDVIQVFCDANNLDIASANALRTLMPWQRDIVITEGPVRGRNPSAILMGRVRKVQAMTC